jgi:hypothetical protein
VAAIVDKGNTSCGTAGALYVLLAAFTKCHWIYSCTYRAKMRAQYKELKARGYDPEIGWQGSSNAPGIQQMTR